MTRDGAAAPGAREEVLRRVRLALGRPDEGRRAGADQGPAKAGPPSPPGLPEYRVKADLSPERLLELLTDRLRDYGATVRGTTPGGAADEVRAALDDRGVRRLLVPPGLDIPGLEGPGSSLPGIEVVVDDGLPTAELDRFDGVLTTAAVAIAETGTIVLDGSPGQGRRALSLVPDYHLCVLREDQVVGLVPEALVRLSAERPLTWISGPSATSDIELDRVQGVHGPRTLDVILVSGPGVSPL